MPADPTETLVCKNLTTVSHISATAGEVVCVVSMEDGGCCWWQTRKFSQSLPN